MTTTGDKNVDSVSLTARTRGNSPASLLRTIAGTPAGWRPSQRRGSFLIIVVGTLALLAVLAIVYSSIGTHDVRMTAAVKKQAALDEVPEQIKDYILSIIGESTLATYYDSREYVSGPIPLSRVTFDYASTNWQASSTLQQVNAANGAMPFTPTGSVAGFMGEFNFTNQTTYPATSMPVRWAPSTPWLADAAPTYVGPALAASEIDSRLHQYKRDWRKISNISPDGRFVNLVHLRGNWEATPADLAADTNLFYTANGNDLTPTNAFGVGVTGAALNVPAYRDSYQRWLFRPARANLAVAPDSVKFEQYSFADADGDGMFDSRWQMLYDSRLSRDFLDIDSKYKVFVATRIVDLSANINVNTAGDQRGVASANPTALLAPVGITPGDIDLRRALTGWDARHSTLDPVAAGGVPTGYDGITHTFPNGAADRYTYAAMDAEVGFQVGIYGYDALRLSLFTGITPPSSVEFRGTDLVPSFETLSGITAADRPKWDFTTRPYSRAEYYNTMSVGMQGASRDLTVTGAASARFMSGFNVDDLFELVARRSTNDPALTSALEMTVGGRWIDTGMEDVYSPLRSNRPLEIERARYTFPIATTANSPFDRTMLFFENDLRQSLTTVSGARHFRVVASDVNNDGKPAIDAFQLGEHELAIDPRVEFAAIQTVGITDEDRAKRAKAMNTMFNAYLDALAPRLGFGNPWLVGTTNREAMARRTEFYGWRGPELAIRVAAHMAVNAVDCFDADRNPTVHTVLIDQELATPLENLDPRSDEGLAVSAWVMPQTERDTFMRKEGTTDVEVRPMELKKSQAARGGRGDELQAPLVNVYGIEAQPFITQVANFTVYADKHTRTISDGESAGNPANIQGGEDPSTNEDLMYRVLAFQIHNPFNKPIQLSNKSISGVEGTAGVDGSSGDDAYYYITFGNKSFKLAEISEKVDGSGNYFSADPPQPAVDMEPLQIPANGTIIVYALTDTPFAILQRMSKLSTSAGHPGHWLNETVAPATVPGKQERDRILRAIESNLGRSRIGAGPTQINGIYWIPEIDNTTGVVSIPRQEPLAQVNGNQVSAQLWRTVKAGLDKLPEPPVQPAPPAPPVPGSPAPLNLTGNDQLVDRLRIYDYEVFNRVLTPTQHEITGSLHEDDKLYTIVLAGQYARPADPRGANIPRGALPGFCLEPKFTPEWNQEFHTSPSTTDLPPETDWVSALSPTTFFGAAETVKVWFDNIEAADSLSLDISKHPTDLGNPIPGLMADGTVRPYDQQYVEVPVLDNNGRTTTGTVPNITSAYTLRPADLLLPFGVGPEEMPFDPTQAPSLIVMTDLEKRWTTLGEAVANSLGYQTSDVYVPPRAAAVDGDQSPNVVDVNAIYYPLLLQPVTDRGGLRLDAFSPFIDADLDGNCGLNESRIGSQAPLALGVLDAFTMSPADANDPRAFPPAPAVPDPRFIYRYETLKRATPGVINANTARVNTLRAAFPMLCPPPNTEPGTANPWWWWAGSQLEQGTDIAATLVAYRDKSLGYTNSVAVPYPGGEPRVVYFDHQSGTPATEDADDGRSSATQILAIHEQSGLRTAGEMLAARYIATAPTPPAPIAPAERGWQSNMDFLGHDLDPATSLPTASALVGVDTLYYRDAAGLPVASEVPNSYKEQLSIINSMLSSVSTRSDYFVCWFLVHGYQKSDVENLGANDPLVPSMARRFVMVVDRSKVTKAGDKPEVLLFKEVPIDPAPRSAP